MTAEELATCWVPVPMPINHTCTCGRPWPLLELEALHARHQAAVTRATGEQAA